jgi:alanyl-tRNA synthetase
MHATEDDLVEHVDKLVQHQRTLEKQLDDLKLRVAQSEAGSLVPDARDVKGVKVLAKRMEGMDRAQLRAIVDSLRNQLKTAVVVLASSENGNVAIVSGVTKDLASKVHAGKLVSAVAQAVGGKGGGRPDMAEAGGKDASALPAALADVYSKVEAML